MTVINEPPSLVLQQQHVLLTTNFFTRSDAYLRALPTFFYFHLSFKTCTWKQFPIKKEHVPLPPRNLKPTTTPHNFPRMLITKIPFMNCLHCKNYVTTSEESLSKTPDFLLYFSPDSLSAKNSPSPPTNSCAKFPPA